MDIANILLWSFSFTLAIIGIAFGIIASINSSRANQKIQNIITASFASEKAQKLFFENIKKIVIKNREAISILQEKEVNFSEYAIVAAQGRLEPISHATWKILEHSEYQNLAKLYLDVKHKFDAYFSDIIPDLEILKQNNDIPHSLRDELIIYHREIIETNRKIMSHYNIIVTKTLKYGKDFF